MSPSGDVCKNWMSSHRKSGVIGGLVGDLESGGVGLGATGDGLGATGDGLGATGGGRELPGVLIPRSQFSTFTSPLESIKTSEYRPSALRLPSPVPQMIFAASISSYRYSLRTAMTYGFWSGSDEAYEERCEAA